MSYEPKKRRIRWTIFGNILAVVLLVALAVSLTRVTRTRDEYAELAELFERTIDQLEGELAEARTALGRAKDSLQQSHQTIVDAANRVGRSQEIARDLAGVLGGLTTGADPIDQLIHAIAVDLEWIARELSGIYTERFENDQ
jgi:methyl-accepting chemotaxis protein